MGMLPSPFSKCNRIWEWAVVYLVIYRSVTDCVVTMVGAIVFELRFEVVIRKEHS